MSNVRLFSELVSVDLNRCGEIKLLPPLGQLCSLKELSIDRLRAVKTIGGEFYGDGAVPFPLLERFEIGYMSGWIEWSHGNMGGEGFPNLQKLRLYGCPKLIGSLPIGLHRLGNLSELAISGCQNLTITGSYEKGITEGSSSGFSTAINTQESINK
ncbi:putative disease resistance RPP13-like protein 1 [Tripterygium wilfordii]|uniref:Putative disease resistance RPP13-like protein 1 n=1 Tax=Tripterygium wilfordii TaxID=458696 RepID=A0A7J7CHY8_TRIWF|nr:putative disease resistance RPP13-like protein 1 [Tripterygium wilfordii]